MIQKSTSWEVYRDYQEAPESSILFKRREYMDGYIHGTLDALEIQPARVCCASARTGAVKRLTEAQAVKLKKSLDDLLLPVVSKEFERLKNMGGVPQM